jgi:hypothetical protein
MKLIRILTLITLAVIVFCTSTFCSPDSGFFLPDSVREMTIRYRSVKNLIVLPVQINGIAVNLILDTGCRNLVLFGKKFEKLLKINPGSKVKFSGLGVGDPVTGSLSLGNRISIEQVLGEKIPVVVVGSKNLFSLYKDIDGVIGFDIFFKFEIELNPKEGLITFRTAEHCRAPIGFTKVPLRLVETHPVMDSKVLINSETARDYELMIDTGSTFGLLVKTTEMSRFERRNFSQTIGIGFNGPIKGYHTTADHLMLNGYMIKDVPTGVMESTVQNCASIGMELLKDYIVVINYFKLYACFKKMA